MMNRYFRVTRLGRLIIVLLVILTLLTVIPIAVGRTRNEPNELETLGFGVCDDRPCFMGIVPGVTSWGDTLSISAKHGGKTSPDDINRITISTDFGQIAILASSNRQASFISVASYVMEHPIQLLSLKRFVALYGTPCYIRTGTGSYIGIVYPYMTLWMIPKKSDLGFDSLVSEVVVQESQLREVSDNFCQKFLPEYAITWHGFASWHRYPALYLPLE